MNENFHSKEVLPKVVTLNVGGTIYTTNLSTLLKSSDSMLAAMFSGRHPFTFDSQGRYFIDRDGVHFRHILNFLRQGALPPLDESSQVYQEAQYYNLTKLCAALEVLRPIAGEKLRRKFLDQVSCYDTSLSLLLKTAQKFAYTQPERITKLRVCVFKEDHHSLAISGQETKNGDFRERHKHKCDVHVTFGPWRGSPGVYDVIDCIKLDLKERGYILECQCIGVCDQHVGGPHFCKRPIYEFKLKWW